MVCLTATAPIKTVSLPVLPVAEPERKEKVTSFCCSLKVLDLFGLKPAKGEDQRRNRTRADRANAPSVKVSKSTEPVSTRTAVEGLVSELFRWTSETVPRQHHT